ncbi:MAG TPA: hypothetical protein VMW27_26515 [Thermoanaerobaculia bacterium]|nr:hypothetical protein [Thermoanaerobaculia bacterium]
MATHGDLDSVRSELRRLGYLDHGFERFLLQDALRPRRPLPTLLRLTAKVGLLAGLALAFALALALAVANGNLNAPPLQAFQDLAALFLHLFPPIAAAVAAMFLALCGLVLLTIRLYHVRRVEALSLAAAVAAGAAGLLLALGSARGLLAESGVPQLLLFAVAAPVAIYALVKLVYHGLLTLTIRFTEAAPPGRLFSRRWISLAILAAAFLLTLPPVLAARRGGIPAAQSLPTGPGERVVLVGIDGVLPEEVDYLLRRGDLPALGGLVRQGGRVLRYRREVEPPASFWTEVATGLPSPEHGVVALDSFLPLGVRTPLARSGPLRSWWSRVGVPLGLAEYRPVLANRRRAFTVWELASRGGEPVLAVNWWATFPAETLPGLVVAHGAYQLLAEGAQGAVAPEAERPWVTAEARAARAESRPVVAAALSPAAAESMLSRALRPDQFYREVFARRLKEKPRAAALYLPGLDIAADGWHGGDVAFADLVRSELAAADRLLARALAPGEVGTVAVVLDPGRRRERGEGRVLLWRRSGCAAAAGRDTTPEAVASGLVRALGLPQSAELPPPPRACNWPDAPAEVEGYGEPHRRQPPQAEGGEYLENLRSLGYL